jgi:hypothetical protein
VRGTTPDDCWSWTASKSVDGYGWIGDGARRVTKAHRVSWQLHFGEIPPDLCVLHHCDNPACANPRHLYLGTQRDNLLDRAARGWRPVGENNPRAKLTAADVRRIRRLMEHGERRIDVASRFRVSSPTIGDIMYRRSWSHVQ